MKGRRRDTSQVTQWTSAFVARTCLAKQKELQHFLGRGRQGDMTAGLPDVEAF